MNSRVLISVSKSLFLYSIQSYTRIRWSFRPPYFFDMLTQEIHQVIVDVISEVAPEVFIVDVSLQKGPKSTLNIKVDTDSGISLEECSRISRKVGWELEEREDMDFPYTLEVSSPGVGSPLKLHRQYLKEIGRHLQVITLDGVEIKGKLLKVEEDSLTLEPLPERKGKKKKAPKPSQEAERQIKFEEIKEAKVIIII